MTVKEIKEYLDLYIEGQEEAKKAAAILVYNKERGVKENICFIGPSGCGKTEIFRTLMRKFPKMIYIFDTSGMSSSGFKGQKKAYSAFSYMVQSGWKKNEIENSIIVLDEFDKVCEPTSSSEGNISHEYQREFLTMIEGTTMRANLSGEGKDEEGTDMINTENISFVFCGAFETIHKQKKLEKNAVPLGFTSTCEKKNDEITIDDLIKFGMRTELAGRISMIALLKPLDRDQVKHLLQDPFKSPVAKLAIKYRYDIHLSKSFFDELIDISQKQDMGVRFLSGAIQKAIDQEIFEIGSSHKLTLHEPVDVIEESEESEKKREVSPQDATH